MKFCYVDSETGPADPSTLERYEPDFNLRNKLDPEKRAKELAEKRAKWYEDAALSPITGRVVGMGYSYPDERRRAMLAGDLEGDLIVQERDLIQRAFTFLRDAHQGAAYKVVGFCLTSFDIPFWIQRAWALDITVPPYLVHVSGRWVRFPSWIIDLRTLWTFGDKWEAGKLGQIAELLGVGTKVQEHSENFHALWKDPETREIARAHLINDLDLTEGLARRMIPTIQPTLENEVQEDQ